MPEPQGFDPISYFFFANQNSGGLTYPELKRRRDIAAALAARGRPFPKTLGEGMTYFGESLAQAIEDRRLASAEREQGERDTAAAPPSLAPQEPEPSPYRPPVSAAPPEPPPQPIAQPTPPQQPIQPGVPGQMTPALQQQLQQKPTAGAAPPLQAPVPDAGNLFDPTATASQPPPTIPGQNPPVPPTPTQVTPPGPTLGAVPAPGSREAIAAMMMQQRGLPASPAQAQGPAGVPGGGGPQGPQYASYGRPGVASDASPGGVGPFPAAAGGIGAAAAALGPPAPPQSGPPVAQNRVRTVPVGPGEMPPMGLPTPGMGAPPPVPPASSAPSMPPAPSVGMQTRPTITDIPPAPQPVQVPDPGAPPAPPRPTPEMMELWRRSNDVRGLSPEARQANRDAFNQLQAQQKAQYDKVYQLWHEDRNAYRAQRLGDPAARVQLEGSHLQNVQRRRELEDTTAYPLTQEERAAFNLGDRPAWKDARGKIHTPAAGTNVNVNTAENKAREAIEKKMADWHIETFNTGIAAGDDLSQIGELRRLGKQFKTGPEAVLKEMAGRFGIQTDKLDAIQAYDAMLKRLTPQQRVPGAGATSDFDAKMFRDSLPGLMRTPGGNEMILNTMEGLARNKLARAEISGRVISGDMSVAEGNRAIVALQREARSFSTQARVATLEGQDRDAYEWARANRNDPRSRAIMQDLGID